MWCKVKSFTGGGVQGCGAIYWNGERGEYVWAGNWGVRAGMVVCNTRCWVAEVG